MCVRGALTDLTVKLLSNILHQVMQLWTHSFLFLNSIFSILTNKPWQPCVSMPRWSCWGRRAWVKPAWWRDMFTTAFLSDRIKTWVRKHTQYGHMETHTHTHHKSMFAIYTHTSHREFHVTTLHSHRSCFYPIQNLWELSQVEGKPIERDRNWFKLDSFYWWIWKWRWGLSRDTSWVMPDIFFPEHISVALTSGNIYWEISKDYFVHNHNIPVLRYLFSCILLLCVLNFIVMGKQKKAWTFPGVA